MGPHPGPLPAGERGRGGAVPANRWKFSVPVMSYAEASRAAIAEEMRRDPTVWAVGEDLGRGGVFGQ